MNKLVNTFALVALPLLSATSAIALEAGSPRLTALDVLDGTGAPAMDGKAAWGKGEKIKLVPDFDPEITEYTVELDSDIHGVRLSAEADEGVHIAISGQYGIDPYRYGKDGRNWNSELFPEGTATVVTTQPLTYNGDGTYDNHGFYDGPVDVNAWVFATNNEGDTARYTVTFKLADGRPDYDLFELHMGDGSLEGYGPVFTAENGIKMPFALYVPSDIEPDEKLPVLMILHGGGDRTRAVDYLNWRQPAATPFARDSEAGKNRAIIVVPQMVTSDYSKTGADWETLGEGMLNPGYTTEFDTDTPPVSWEKRAGSIFDYSPSEGESPFGAAAFELLTRIIAGELEETSLDDDLASHIDTSRIYLTGLSMGGAGTIAQMTSHPDVYAAFAPLAAISVLSDTAAQALQENKVPVLIGHNADDPIVDVEFSHKTIAELRNAGYTDDLLKTVIYPSGTYTYESPHTSWYAFYNQESVRDWIFEQKRESDPSLPDY